ncbi:MAG: primosomal protein N' [Planctomycetes bacterium]|nr:primosomal protein N' [Planctomycetota bacterium]
MDKLFQDVDDSADQPADVVGVAVAANVWSAYDYSWPADWPEPEKGLRVRVPFGAGNRPTGGFIVRVGGRQTDRKLKFVAERVDSQPQLDAELFALAEWIAGYYLTPLGLVLPAMVPSAVGATAPRTASVAWLNSEPADWPGQLGQRQRRFLDELLESRKQGVEPVAVERLLSHSGAARQTLQRLVHRKLVRIESRPVVLADLQGEVEADPFELNADQQVAAESIIGKLGKGFSPVLLYGVTGSGKTEVYIRAIRAAVDAGGQVILLTPEIALATQTLQRLIHRLPRVAVLHSALTGAQRAFYYQQIRDGHAAVVIGPRSAVFAPARKLAMIIVDEEHEATYKQDNSPRYHGRDVAVKRAAIGGVPIVLGSATPSLESHLNVMRGRYEQLVLPRRVKGLPMPKLKLVHLRKDLAGTKLELIGRTLTSAMAAALDADHQVILLMNRRGYASYVFCPSCQWQMQCDDCSRAMVYHQATQLAMCHYCQRTAGLPTCCPACGKKLLLFGMGIQRIEDELGRKFPLARVARMDSDTMTSSGQFERVLDDFRSGEIDILLGTQMVAKGLDFPRVSLVGVASADTSLMIPDFRSAERTFQLIVQVAGRAGRTHSGGQVIVQTLHPSEPAIQKALDHDYDGFAELELSQRQEVNLPPYCRMVRLLVRHSSQQRCQQAAEQLAVRLRQLFNGDGAVSITGAMPAPIARIRKLFRWQVLLTSPSAGTIQARLGPVMDDLSREIPAEVVADVDPVCLA